jgi:hypothetical protein
MLTSEGQSSGSAYPHFCQLASSPLADRHLRLECPEQEAGDDEEQALLWEKFSSPPPVES